MPLAKDDCAGQVENMKLLYAQDYLKLVSSPEQSAGPFPTDTLPQPPAYNAWPPGPKPSPEKWTDPKSGTTWTRVLIDAKWMYQSSRNKRLFITSSALYDLIGLPKDSVTGFVPKVDLPQPPFDWAAWANSTSGARILVGGAALLCALFCRKGK